MPLQVTTTLSPEDLDEFKRLTLEQYGVQLSDEEALEDGLDLINFIAAVLDATESDDLHGHLEVVESSDLSSNLT